MISSPEEGIFHIQGEEGEVFWDTRYSPIFAVITYGKLSVQIMEEWYSVRNPVYEKLQAKSEKFASISDISNWQLPDAILRKELSKIAYDNDIPFKDAFVGQVFVLTNPILRGAITAIAWVSGDGSLAAPTSYASNLSSALKETEKYYKKLGIPMPSFPKDYKFQKSKL